jgi:hypothetical protein
MAEAVKQVYLTPKQLEQRLEGAVKLLTLANWRASTPRKGPPFVKIGSRVLYPIDKLEAWEAANLQSPANDNENT